MDNIDEKNDSRFDAKSPTSNKDFRTENLLLNGAYIPDVFLNIFCYLDSKSILQSRSVCKSWKDVIDRNVWYERAKRYKKNSYSNMEKFEFSKFNVDLPVAFAVDKYDPFNRNMLRNVCGEENFRHWAIPRVHRRYVTRENSPVGSDALPDDPDFNGNRSCFATSYEWCKMKQVIDLREYGINGHIMDFYRPSINVSGWYAGRFDAGCRYKLKVSLLNENHAVIKTEMFTRDLSVGEGTIWNKASLILEDYPPGVRYICYMQYGKDTPWWAGFYGVKMAGSCVTLSCPIGSALQ